MPDRPAHHQEGFAEALERSVQKLAEEGRTEPVEAFLKIIDDATRPRLVDKRRREGHL